MTKNNIQPHDGAKVGSEEDGIVASALIKLSRDKQTTTLKFLPIETSLLEYMDKMLKGVFPIRNHEAATKVATLLTKQITNIQEIDTNSLKIRHVIDALPVCLRVRLALIIHQPHLNYSLLNGLKISNSSPSNRA